MTRTFLLINTRARRRGCLRGFGDFIDQSEYSNLTIPQLWTISILTGCLFDEIKFSNYPYSLISSTTKISSFVSQHRRHLYLYLCLHLPGMRIHSHVVCLKISAWFGIKILICFAHLYRAGSLPNSPMSSSGFPPSRLERKLTIKAKELKDALQSCHTLKDESICMKKSLEDLQTALEEKEKALRSAEYERDLLEKEKVLYDTQVKVRLRSTLIRKLLSRHVCRFCFRINEARETEKQKEIWESYFHLLVRLRHFFRRFSWCREYNPVMVSSLYDY